MRQSPRSSLLPAGRCPPAVRWEHLFGASWTREAKGAALPVPPPSFRVAGHWVRLGSKFPVAPGAAFAVTLLWPLAPLLGGRGSCVRLRDAERDPSGGNWEVVAGSVDSPARRRELLGGIPAAQGRAPAGPAPRGRGRGQLPWPRRTSSLPRAPIAPGRGPRSQ